MKNAVRRFLRSKRAEKDLSQDELCKTIGIKRGTYARWEATGALSVIQFLSVINALGCKFSEFEKYVNEEKEIQQRKINMKMVHSILDEDMPKLTLDEERELFSNLLKESMS